MKTIIVEEDVGIKKIKQFKEVLESSLNEDNEVLLNFKDVKRLDLSVMQVIISAMKDAKINQKKIKLKGLVSPQIKVQFDLVNLLKN